MPEDQHADHPVYSPHRAAEQGWGGMGLEVAGEPCVCARQPGLLAVGSLHGLCHPPAGTAPALPRRGGQYGHCPPSPVSQLSLGSTLLDATSLGLLLLSYVSLNTLHVMGTQYMFFKLVQRLGVS